MLIHTRTNVLLPESILRQQSSLSEQEFLKLVLKYLTRYPNYRLVTVNNGFAVCDREDDKQLKKRKK